MRRIVTIPALLLALVACLGAEGQAQDKKLLPPGDEKPVPRPEADGPTSFVTAAVFSPDGKTLYVGGWDKVVHVWTLDAQGKFVLDRAAAYRVPVGPGLLGSINALALSQDGNWLAVAGNGLGREDANFRNFGILLPSLGISPETRLDRGLIYVFQTRTREVRLLRGHEGFIQSLAFAPPRPGQPAEQPPALVSAGREWDGGKNQEVGGMRVWDLEKRETVARVAGMPQSNAIPGLAAWRNPQQLVRAAVAWDDGLLRLWEPEKGEASLKQVKDGSRNNTVAYLPNTGKLLTGSFAPDDKGVSKGWVQAWQVGADGPQAERGQLVAFGKTDQDPAYYVPRALALNPAGDLAAVVHRVQNPDKSEEDRLQLLRMVAGKPSVVGGMVKVAEGGGTQPVVAASANHVAVAGNRAHEVQVYATTELLKGAAKPQVLRSIAETIRSATFVTRGKDRGLALSPTGKKAGAAPRVPQIGDLIFDITGRKLAGDVAGWKLDVPAAGEWTVVPEIKKDVGGKVQEASLVVSQGAKVVGRVPLKLNQNVTDFALLPPTPPLNAPILAVATHHLGQPDLLLYHVPTSQAVRQLAGHSERITSLAFAGDGQILVSSADDQTVCVWSLADLAKIVGQRGLVSGLALRDGDNATVVVGRVDDDSPVKGLLKENDLVTALVEKGLPMPLNKAREFYTAVWETKPGDSVVVRVKGGGDVKLPVGQGADSRKPLFCFFVTRGAARDWLAWSPTGPYDASRDEAERYLGWHINTGKAEAPTRFAEAGQYKKEYHKPDILKHLMARASLDGALEDWDREIKAKKQAKKLPEPNMNLRLAEAGPDPVRMDGAVLVRTPPQTLKLAIDNFSPEDVGTVEWTITGLTKEPQKFTAPLGREWSADVSKLPWQRGVYKARAEIQTQEDTPRKYIQELVFRYQPPAPVVTAKAGRVVVDKADFPFQAEIKPATAGQAVNVLFAHRFKDKDLVAEAQELKFNKALKLQPGDNYIEVIAVNQGVPAGFEVLETTRTVLEVTYAPPIPDPLPIITLESVVPLQGGKEGPPIAVVPGLTLVVDAEKVRIKGRIQATKNLAQAEWGKVGGKAEPLPKFAADKTKDVALIQDVTLEPGPQRFRFAAKTVNSDPAEATLAVHFKPALPRVVLTAPAPGLVLYEGKAAPEVEVRFQVLEPKPTHPFETMVSLNEQHLKLKPEMDAKGQLAAKVPLQPGDNRIRFCLKNQWHAEETCAELVLVRYLRPPQVVKIAAPAESEEPFVELVAAVQSAVPLLPESVDAEVTSQAMGQRRRINTFEVIKPKEGQTWTVRLKDVPLEVGANEVRLFVSNTEARSLEPSTQTVTYKKKPPPKPEVEILDPRDSLNVTSRELTVQFRVVSKSPLRRLEFIRQAGDAVRQPIDASKLKPNAQGVYELKLALRLVDEPGKLAPIDVAQLKPNPQGFLEAVSGVSLQAKDNRLRVEAVNDGGQEETAVVVNYFAMPVRLVIDQLEPRGWAGSAVKAESRAEGQVSFPPIEQGKVWLRGRILWDKDKDEQLKQVNAVQVYVNGLRQPPVALEPVPGGARERTFRAAVALIDAKDNKVEVEVPGLKLDASTRREFSVACKQPESMRLHVLIIGINSDNEQLLTERALKTLNVANQEFDPGQRRFRKGDHLEGRVYPPLVGYVRPGQVLTELRRIKDEIDLLARTGSTSDVMWIFHDGLNATQGGQEYLLTSVSQHIPDLQRSGIALGSLESCLADTLGAQLLLGNLVRSGKSETPPGAGDRWPVGPRFGVFVYERSTESQAVSLSEAMSEAMARSTKLGDVAAQVRKTAEKHKPLVLFIENIQGNLKNLTVAPGGKR